MTPNPSKPLIMVHNNARPGINWQATISAPNPKNRIVIRLVPVASVAPAASAGVVHAMRAPNVVMMCFMMFSFPYLYC